MRTITKADIGIDEHGKIYVKDDSHGNWKSLSSEKIKRIPISFDIPNINIGAFPIVALDQEARSFSIDGNQVNFFPPNFIFQVVGSTGNDNTYTVVNSVFVDGKTVITVVDDIDDTTVDGIINNSSSGGKTTAGIEIYVPKIDEWLITASVLSMFSITTPWNGNSPQGYIIQKGQSNYSSVIGGGSYVDLTLEDQDASNEGNESLVQPARSIWGSGAYPIKFKTTTPLMFVIDDSLGGNPESTQGKAELVLVILTS